MTGTAENFDDFESTAIVADDDALVVTVDGFEGPLGDFQGLVELRLGELVRLLENEVVAEDDFLQHGCQRLADEVRFVLLQFVVEPFESFPLDFVGTETAVEDFL